MIISITLLGVLSIAVYAGSIPGSEEDPIVTLSYVNTKIDELKAYIDTAITNQSPDSETDQGNQEDSNVTTAAYEIINLVSGQKLIGKESTEMILRSGEAEVIVSGVNGISDITVGEDLKNGEQVSQNHLLLIPRDDGRGIKALSEVYVMVKGNYSIQ